MAKRLWFGHAEPGGGVPPSNPIPLGLRFYSRCNSNAKPCDFLLAFDCVLAESGVHDYPSAALPLGATNIAEQASVNGLGCGDNWTIELAGEVPDHCWDLTDVNRPLNKVLCTLFESATKWISVTHEVDSLVLRFTGGESVSVKAGEFQSFQALRGSPILFAVSCAKSGSQGKYRLSASVGGTEVFSTYAISLPLVRPTQIRFGDANNQSVEAMLWYGGRIHNDVARTESQMATALANLDMLFQKSEPLPPGSIA